MTSTLEYTTKKEIKKMSILPLLKEAPFLCGAENAGRWARVAELVFNDELDNPDGPFKQSSADIEEPRNRIHQVMAWADSCVDRKKASHILDRCELLNLKHRELEHGDTDPKRHGRAEFLEVQIRTDEKNYPDVAALLPLEQILLGFWV